jgi:hypothetical protein
MNIINGADESHETWRFPDSIRLAAPARPYHLAPI